MLYRNVKTGAEFESESVCNGGDWVIVTPAPAKEKKTEDAPRTAAKKGKK